LCAFFAVSHRFHSLILPPAGRPFFVRLIFKKFDVPQILFVFFHRFAQNRRPIAQIRQIVVRF